MKILKYNFEYKSSLDADLLLLPQLGCARVPAWSQGGMIGNACASAAPPDVEWVLRAPPTTS